MRRTVAAASFALALGPLPLLPPVATTPEPEVPELTAEAWVLYDVDAAVVLAEHNAAEARPMASVTKIMTALVVLENAQLDEKVRISQTAAAVGESEIGLVAGERWSVADLLAAVMVRSGNDAAVALAEHVGGSVAGFADLMNAKAAELGLEETNFVNPHGLDAPEHYTSALDLVVMAAAALEDPYMMQLARTRLITFTPDPSGVTRQARNTNRLLGVYPGVVGLKTGFTGKAGRVLVSVLEHNDRTLVGVVMGSEDHFADSRELLDYGARTLSLRDRLLAPLIDEEGGGAPTVGGVRLDADDRARLSAVRDMSDGTLASSSMRLTTRGRQIEEWLRSVAPVTLGGRS